MSAHRSKPRPCLCGSGLDSEPVHDGHGIYLFRACDECLDNKLGGYRPDILTRYRADEPIEPDSSEDWSGLEDFAVS